MAYSHGLVQSFGLEMGKVLSRTGWVLSYFQILLLLPFGTCTGGNDLPWALSILYGVVPLIGLTLILASRRKIRKSTLMGLPHVLTLFLILWETPSYWIRCTFQGQHICAGFSEDYINAFQPELWHRFWAPIVTTLGLAFVVLGFVYFKNYMHYYRTRASSGSATNSASR
jgi:hypothetical protein